ncbi:hypothetical protein A7D17_13725 [Xanthomonas floridensis]|uniref:Uncharacterized protein n=1 Tax=Xanthomonas floridensis TaxID=1843580 RepID=A0A1A9MFX2_9XANT|nr:hypothetical protein A7D17_13725 [Xanthomonas floridensis]
MAADAHGAAQVHPNQLTQSPCFRSQQRIRESGTLGGVAAGGRDETGDRVECVQIEPEFRQVGQQRFQQRVVCRVAHDGILGQLGCQQRKSRLQRRIRCGLDQLGEGLDLVLAFDQLLIDEPIVVIEHGPVVGRKVVRRVSRLVQ